MSRFCGSGVLPATIVCLTIALVSAPHAIAADPAAKCATAKQKAAGKELAAKLKCHAKAILGDEAVDMACLEKAETKFEEAFVKAESGGACVTDGDADGVEQIVDDALAELLAALPSDTTTTTTTTTMAPAPESCANGVDDDGDWSRDCYDRDCFSFPACVYDGSENCTNGSDDDGDTKTDCADPSCQALPSCNENYNEATCTDNIDNDGDAFADCSDLECADEAVCAD